MCVRQHLTLGFLHNAESMPPFWTGTKHGASALTGYPGPNLKVAATLAGTSPHTSNIGKFQHTGKVSNG
jgi:hypothetical protein